MIPLTSVNGTVIPSAFHLLIPDLFACQKAILVVPRFTL